MTSINREVTVDAPVDRVWAALADFGNVAVWNPGVKKSSLTSTQTQGSGISRECQLLPVGTVQEEVTDWVEGESMTIEISEFKNVPGMRKGGADIHVRSRGDQTDVHLELSYEVGLGAVGASMNSMMLKRQFAKAAVGLLAGLKHHIETGASVQRGTKLPTGEVLAA
jgi:carbon monoxide dehydrogenase subunit G